MIVGREQVSPQRLEDMARPFTVADLAPFQTFGFYVKQTRGRRMRSGEMQPVEVEVHPDPRCQEMLEQIREAEIVQAADRVRPIFNERSIVLLNELALDVTYDRIVTHKELAMDGSRFEQAAARGAAVPLSASELARCFPDLWPSAGAVKQDFQRSLNGYVSQIELLFGKRTHLIRARYRRPGQVGRPSPAAIWADADGARSALEAVVGPVEVFEIEQLSQAAEVESENTPVSQIDAAAPEAGRVVPFPPSAVKELHQLQCIVGAAERLADLSTRLERARSPPDPSHSANAWRRSGERPSGSEWVTR
jgi:hypothetical protein